MITYEAAKAGLVNAEGTYRGLALSSQQTEREYWNQQYAKSWQTASQAGRSPSQAQTRAQASASARYQQSRPVPTKVEVQEAVRSVRSNPYRNPVVYGNQENFEKLIDTGEKLGQTVMQQASKVTGGFINPQLLKDLASLPSVRGISDAVGFTDTDTHGMSWMDQASYQTTHFAAQSALLFFDPEMNVARVGAAGVDRVGTWFEAGENIDNGDMLRRVSNIGEFSDLKVPMQFKIIKGIANEAGIGLSGVKVKIIRDPELLKLPYLGRTTPNGEIELYPNAFSNTETLVKTLGHERTHVFQIDLYGHPDNLENGLEHLQLNENAAYSLENSYWKYYQQNKSGIYDRYEENYDERKLVTPGW